MAEGHRAAAAGASGHAQHRFRPAAQPRPHRLLNNAAEALQISRDLQQRPWLRAEQHEKCECMLRVRTSWMHACLLQSHQGAHPGASDPPHLLAAARHATLTGRGRSAAGEVQQLLGSRRRGAGGRSASLACGPGCADRLAHTLRAVQAKNKRADPGGHRRRWRRRWHARPHSLAGVWFYRRVCLHRWHARPLRCIA